MLAAYMPQLSLFPYECIYARIYFDCYAINIKACQTFLLIFSSCSQLAIAGARECSQEALKKRNGDL